jgi:protein TonB
VYPEQAHNDGIEGTVWVKIWVDEHGNARKAVILRTDAEILNQATIDASMNWKFKPAMMDGKPVAVWVTIPFKFKMDNPKANQPKTK